MALSAVIGALRVDLGLNTAQFNDGLRGVQKSLGKVGKRMQNVGRQMSVGLTAPIVGFAALTLRSAGDFEQGMNRVQAVSGATGEQFEALRNQAKELGATTQFSASQAADGMAFLAQAGFDANEIIGAMPGTLQLASAAQMDLGEAADIVSNVLQGYGLDVDELGRANDVLVATFTKTNTSLSQLGEAMKFAAPVASSAGVDFEEAAAALGLMGNAGIQASMAGTSLRGAISRVVNPTNKAKKAMEDAGLSFTDTEGRLHPLVDIVRQLEPLAEDTGLFMELFGQRAGPAMAALVSQGADSLGDLTAELENSGGTAERVAAVQMEGFNGAMRELKSAFEGLQLAIADAGLIEFATDAVKAITKFVQKLNETSPAILKWGTIIAGVLAVGGPVLIGLGLLATTIAAISAPVAFVIGALVVLAVGIIAFWDDIEPVVSAIGAGFMHLWEGLKNDIATVKQAFNDFAEFIDQPLGDILDQSQSFLVDQLGAVWEKVKADLQAIRGVFVSIFGEEIVAAFEQFHIDMFNIATAMMTKLRETIAGGFTWIGDKIKGSLDFITGLWRKHEDDVVGNSIVPDMIDAIIDQFERLQVGIGQPTQAAMDDVVEAFTRGSGQAQGAFQGFGSAAQETESFIGGPFKSTLQTAFNDVTTALRNGETSWKTFADIALDALDSIVNKLLDDLMGALNQVNSAAGGGGGLLGGLLGIFGLGPSTPASNPMGPAALNPSNSIAQMAAQFNVKPFAEGGIVRRPTIGLIGEAGAEAVIPLREMADRTGGRAGQPAINQNFDFRGANVSEAQFRQIVEENNKRLMQALQKHRRLDGGFMGVS